MKTMKILPLGLSFLLFSTFAACDDSAKKAVCGDGKAAGSESCDGLDLRGQTCTSLGYYGGTLACSDACGWDLASCEAAGRCGDGAIQASREQCDGTDLGGASCASIGLGSGTLACSTNCRLDTAGCEIQPVCGDGRRQGGEECDGSDFAGASCSSLGFAGGTLACTASCTIDTTGCTSAPACGDNVAEGGEECDGTDFAGASCSSLGYYGGTLACTANCTRDTSSCAAAGRCGDATIQAAQGEECDGDDLGGATCESRGFAGGTLACSPACRFDTSLCGQSQTEIVCRRWNQDRADMSEGIWSGDVNQCVAGDIGAPGRANALRIVNLYRYLAGLPAVTTDPALDAKAQQCALMMTANNQLNHYPPTSWTCYTQDGATAAGSSNLASTAAVAAVDLYMVDPGNPQTIGHRRWILSNSFGPTGIGSTHSYSCMWAFGSGSASKPWTAFPTPGIFPVQAITASWSSVDQTGWTVQSDSISLSGAQVTITMDGSVPRPVSVTQLLGGYGSSYAISMIPQGWTSQAGHTYHVEITGINPTISYDVQMVDCSGY